MQEPYTYEDINNYSPSIMKALIVEQSQRISIFDQMIRKLEREVERLSAALGAKHQQVLFTAEILDGMRQQKFGRKSERLLADESPLFKKENETAESEVKSHKRKKRDQFGRKAQPELAVQPVHSRFDEEDVKKFGLIEWKDQYETSEVITVIPSRVILQRYYRHKYIRTNPQTGEKSIVTAPGPLKLKEKNRYSIEFAVEVGLAKYHWHLPLDRQVRMFAEHGLDVTSQVLFEQIDTVAWYLRSTVLKGITQDIAASYVNIADDTTWMNLAKLSEKETSKFYLWGVTNRRALAFNIFDSRSQEVAKSFLGNLSGVLVSDGHASFKALASDKLRLANDWYHVRRKFLLARKSFPVEADFFIKCIRELSEIENSILGKPPSEVLEARTNQSKPIVESIRREIDRLGNTLPKCSLGKAFAYVNTLWEGLTVFLTDPLVPMHSNDIERAMRGPALGRKNHYGSKSLATAETTAIWYSIVETCKLNKVDPRQYLVTTLKAILSKQPYKMPWEWQQPTMADIILS